MNPEEFLAAAEQWAAGEPDVLALLLVGSWAKGNNRPDSDMDLMVLTDNKAKFLDAPDYFERFGQIDRRDVEYYGRCTSVRVFFESGPEVEFGLVDGKWASQPLEGGTRRVLSDGYRVLVDKSQIFDGLTL